jgi:hypothetical protein
MDLPPNHLRYVNDTESHYKQESLLFIQFFLRKMQLLHSLDTTAIILRAGLEAQKRERAFAI